MPPACRHTRYRTLLAGFSLVELCVVVAIIAILVSLLLPAVQSSRESSRRAQCANNLRQLALAVLDYEATNKKLPSAGLTSLTRDKQHDVQIFNFLGGPRFSWIVLVLPYIEQENLYHQFDLNKMVLFQDGSPQATVIPTLLCPSDDAANRFYNYQDIGRSAKFAKGNYAAFVSPFHVDLQLLYPGALVAGGQSLSQILGGTSRRLLLSEVRTLDHSADQRGAWALPFAGSSLLAFDLHPVGWPYAHEGTAGITAEVRMRARYEPSPDSLGKAQPPNNQGVNKDTIEQCSQVADLAQAAQMPCNQRNLSPGLRGYVSSAPRSLHIGGVNAGYLDGHVSFLPNDIDQIVMALEISTSAF